MSGREGMCGVELPGVCLLQGGLGRSLLLAHLFMDRASSESGEWGIHKLILLEFLVTVSAQSDMWIGDPPNSEGGA